MSYLGIGDVVRLAKERGVRVGRSSIDRDLVRGTLPSLEGPCRVRLIAPADADRYLETRGRR